MASRMLSVPPDVTTPHTSRGVPRSLAPAPPPSIEAVMETISDSNFTALGHRSL